jgi:hypothetical protein
MKRSLSLVPFGKSEKLSGKAKQAFVSERPLSFSGNCSQLTSTWYLMATLL